MPVEKPVYEFPEQLTLLEEDETASATVSVAEARMRREAARLALEGRKDVSWISEYEKLLEGGWNFRIAAYIAWASSPQPRTPKTQDELAREFLGLTSDRQIIKWRKNNPIIDETVSMLQASKLWDARADVFDALVQNASKPDYKTHNDRKLFLEMTGDYVPSAKLAAMITKNGISSDELAEKSDDELFEIMKQLRNQAQTSSAVVDEDEPSE